MYELIIDVEDTPDDEVIVRAWIDYLQIAALSSEVELELSKQGHSQWTANFCIPKENVEDEDDLFAYRVGLIARPGASWSLRIREHDDKLTRTLVEDGDVLTTRKEWLLGTCDTQR